MARSTTSTNGNGRWKLWLILFLGTALVVMVFVIVSSRYSVPTIQVARVTRTTIESYVSSNGKIEPIDAHVFRAEFETVVTGVFAKEGERVRRGETILTLDAGETRADLAQARIDLLAAKDDLRDARGGGPPDQEAQLTGDIRRAQVDVDHLESRQHTLEGLLADRAATQDEVGQNAAALARARAVLETLQKKQTDFANKAASGAENASLRAQQAEELIKTLESKIASATAIATADGTVYSLPVRVNDYVKPGTTLAEEADLHQLRLRAFVDEADLGGLKLNQPVKITWDAMPGKVWVGKTEAIPQQVVARGTRSVGEVLCSVANNDLKLLPNVNVDVEILVKDSHNALVVPRGAVHSEQDKHFVFVVNGDHIFRREVSVGIASSTSYEVLSGLTEGDTIALSSDLDLRDGAAVHAVEEQ